MTIGNSSSSNSARYSQINMQRQGKISEKLSSSKKINRAADDAAGLAISEKLRRLQRGINQASQNAYDGISAARTAEGATVEIHDMVHRLDELSVRGANGLWTDEDRSYMNMEVNQTLSEIDRVSDTTKFNEKPLLDGSFNNVGLQVGADSNQTIDVNIDKLSAAGLGLNNATSNTSASFNDLNNYAKNAGNKLSSQRASLGATENRLEHTIRNLNVNEENTVAAESRIRDTDYAKSIMDLTNSRLTGNISNAMINNASSAYKSMMSGMF